MQAELPPRTNQTPTATQRFAVFVMIALGVAVAALPFLPPITRHPHQHYQFDRRTTQLRSLSQGLLIYAENHRDNFPDQNEWQDVLVSTGLIEAGIVISPLSEGEEASYFLAPNRGNSMDPTELMLYENPKHDPKGVLVAFMDGRVELVDHDVFEQLLAVLRNQE